MKKSMRIAYLTGEYPRATDTFIQREVMVLREKGADVQTFSIRRPGNEHLVGSEQKAERDRTYYILPAHPVTVLLSHLSFLLRSPGNYLHALKLAWSTRQPGLQGTLYQLFYFVEAGILAKQIREQQIQHLHNHLADSSCTVAMLAAELGGFIALPYTGLISSSLPTVGDWTRKLKEPYLSVASVIFVALRRCFLLLPKSGSGCTLFIAVSIPNYSSECLATNPVNNCYTSVV
jgi:hypothetical protein